MLNQELEEWKASCMSRDDFLRIQRAKMAKEAAEAAAVRARAELAAIVVYGAARMQTLCDAVLDARSRRKVGPTIPAYHFFVPASVRRFDQEG